MLGIAVIMSSNMQPMMPTLTRLALNGLFKQTSLQLMSCWPHKECPKKLLDISESTAITEETLKKYYQKMVLKHHPDHGGKSEDFIKIKDAFEHLMYVLKTDGLPGKNSSSFSTNATTTGNSNNTETGNNTATATWNPEEDITVCDLPKGGRCILRFYKPMNQVSDATPASQTINNTESAKLNNTETTHVSPDLKKSWYSKLSSKIKTW